MASNTWMLIFEIAEYTQKSNEIRIQYRNRYKKQSLVILNEKKMHRSSIAFLCSIFRMEIDPYCHIPTADAEIAGVG